MDPTSLKCSICGAYFLGDAKLFSKNVCPDCKRQGLGVSPKEAAKAAAANAKAEAKAEEARIKAQVKAEEEAERRAEAKIKAAAHKQAIQNIKDYVFDDSSDEEFNKSIIIFMDGYSECHPGILADNDYKKAYKSRVEKELKVLKVSKPDYAEKLNSHYQEAVEALKKKTKTRLIISAVIIGIAMIALPIFLISDGSSSIGSSIGLGILGGLVFGSIFATIPQSSIGKTKTNDE